MKSAAETARERLGSLSQEQHAEFLDMIVRNGDLALLLLERIGLARDIDQGTVAHVTIRNHGGGVTPGDTERIFEKFERLDPRAPGTGLGLFISRGLARAHGGDIQVQPAEDVGSEFILTLPL